MRIGSTIVLPLILLLGCNAETAEDVTHGAVQRGVEVTRGVGSGIVKGAREGRESTDSVDGAHVVSTYEQLAQHGSVEVRAAQEVSGQTLVTLQFTNTTAEPLRIAHLHDDGALLALDSENVARECTGRPSDFTVHPNSAHPINVTFPVPLGEVQKIRVWGHELNIPR